MASAAAPVRRREGRDPAAEARQRALGEGAQAARRERGHAGDRRDRAGQPRPPRRLRRGADRVRHARQGERPSVDVGGLATARQLLEASLGESRAIGDPRQPAPVAGAGAVRVPAPRRPSPGPQLPVERAPPDDRARARPHATRSTPRRCSAACRTSCSATCRFASRRCPTISPDVVTRVESQLERRLSSVVKRPTESHTADGVQTLIDILNRSDRTTERSIFEGLETPRRRARRRGPIAHVRVRGHRLARRPRRAARAAPGRVEGSRDGAQGRSRRGAFEDHRRS